MAMPNNRRNYIQGHTDSEGFTLVELMMTLLIFGVVLGVIGNVFFTTQGLYGRTSQRANQQMSVRSGLTVMVEEIRRAGADPLLTGMAGLVTADSQTVHVRAELNDIAGIQTAEPSEDVTYTYDAAQEILFRDSGTGPLALINNVSDFRFQYFDGANVELLPLPLTAAQAGIVKSISILIVTTTNQGGDVSSSTRVGLRNQ